MHNERSLSEIAGSILGEMTKRLRNRKAPSSTYRIQLSKEFTLHDAAGVVPYLRELGITHLYSSPFLRATAGSPHGYDVVAYDQVSPELGGEEALGRLVEVLAENDIGLIVDFVPNHMGIGSENELWQDVLENGPSSAFARFFDIVWKPVKDELENKVLLPVLGDQYGAVLEAGELRLEYLEGSFWIRYYDHRFPINPRHYPMILERGLEEYLQQQAAAPQEIEELLSICTACNNLPPRTETDPLRIAERRREKEIIKRRLDQLCTSSPAIRSLLENDVDELNGVPGDPASFDALDALLATQAYRLAHWRVAGEEINYRRFFDINDLAAIRMEDPQVFEQSHELILRLLSKGWIEGLRIDHPDGLFDPEAYFHRLQVEVFLNACRTIAREQFSDLPFEMLEPLLRGAWASDPKFQKPLYIVVEKILIGNENVPERWAVEGTTGYDFLNRLAGIFVDARNRKAFDEIYSRFTGLRKDVGELLYEKKKLIMSTSMASEVNILAYQLNRISEMNRRSRDFTLNSLRSALIEYIACFPVYRTYITPARVDEQDRRCVEHAISRAKRRSPVINVSIFDFLRDILLLRQGSHLEEEERRQQIEFTMKLQQLTGPVMAKGFEDTTFYVFNRLVALNEVGGDPAQFGSTVAEFHATNVSRSRGSLLASTTHDTKRSEDTRARLLALSEFPREWRSFLSAASKAARKHRIRVSEDRFAPDRNEEILLYQTLLSTWPFEEMGPAEKRVFTSRIEAYLLKAAKEAKVNTSWINPDSSWDEALVLFVQRLLGEEDFLKEFLPLHRLVCRVGVYNSLSQTLLKLTSPGIPDTYQGCEHFCFSLVDPDNRRPIDFSALAGSLEDLERDASVRREALASELWASREDGRLKQYLTWQVLGWRRSHPELFQTGEYLPVDIAGPLREHVVALSRRRGSRHLIAAVPRLVGGLLEERPGSRPFGAGEESPWQGTYLLLPGGTGNAPWLDLLTGRTIRPEPLRQTSALPLASLWDILPAALLVPADPRRS